VKILLIAPRNPESFWTFDRVLATLGKKCVYPNLSLPTVAGLTPRQHEIVLCDENVEEIDFDRDADIVGITGYVIHRRRILEIAAEFRRRGKFVVVGGPYATLCAEEIAPLVDVVFTGEAEESWPRFLADFARGQWQVEYQEAGKPSLDDAPLPRFDLLRAGAYQTMTVQFGRGCPYNCEFCDIIVMYGRRPRTKSPQRMLAEIEETRRLGARTVFLVDDNFIGNRREAMALLMALGEWQRANDFPLEFMTEATLNLAQDEELLQAMVAANFATVFIGIETPRAASLRETRKTQNLREDLRVAVRRIQEAGIEVMAGMIVGFDHDDATIFEEQFRFIDEAAIPISMTGMLNALPKTPLYERLRVEGRLLEESVGDQFVVSNVQPRAMTRLELYEGYGALLRRLYDYGNFRRRSMRLIRTVGTRRRRATSVSGAELRTLARFLLRGVFLAEPRRAWMTARLLGETALRRPAALPMAVALALMHMHLHDYVQTIQARLAVLVETLRPAAGESGNAPVRS